MEDVAQLLVKILCVCNIGGGRNPGKEAKNTDDELFLSPGGIS